MKTAIYRYKANDEQSYDELAQYASTLPVEVCLFPTKCTITIHGDAHKEVGEFIDAKGLNFHIEPIEGGNMTAIMDEVMDTQTLREVLADMTATNAELTAKAKAFDKELSKLEYEASSHKEKEERYYGWWKDEEAKTSRIKSQVDAIAVLLTSIFPDK